MPEPGNFFEAKDAEAAIAKFDSNGRSGGDVPQEMQMLVAVRMRPLWQKEAEAGDFSCVRVMDGKVVVVTDPWYDADLNPNRHQEKRYAFDVVFDQDVAQMDVYEKTAKGLVNGVLDGYNASVFAYGATGAGKTYTMLGSLDEPGIMFNTLHDTFERMKTEFQESKFKVTLSYVEIYNEMIKANASSAPNPHHALTTPSCVPCPFWLQDLLMPTSVDLKLNEDPVRGMVVQGITEFGANSADEILELLHRGNLHRTVEPTAANQVSSRSHAVLQVTIEQSERTAHVTGNVRIGKLSLVDLAGSERASKTDNSGARLKEGANINRSLLALGNCITALADKNRRGHVPYRDSKMTRLLKDSLGGNCRTVMISNISPSHSLVQASRPARACPPCPDPVFDAGSGLSVIAFEGHAALCFGTRLRCSSPTHKLTVLQVASAIRGDYQHAQVCQPCEKFEDASGTQCYVSFGSHRRVPTHHHGAAQ